MLVDGIDIVGFEEKPVTRSYVNAGIYVLDPLVIDFINTKEVLGLPTIFERCKAAQYPIMAYALHEHWMDIGMPEDLKAANVDIGSDEYE